MKLTLPSEKRLRISNLISSSLKLSQIKIEVVANLIGTLVPARPAIDYSAVYIRSLETDKTAALLRCKNN